MKIVTLPHPASLNVEHLQNEGEIFVDSHTLKEIQKSSESGDFNLVVKGNHGVSYYFSYCSIGDQITSWPTDGPPTEGRMISFQSLKSFS